ncbi:MAG: hypothetical protein ACYDEX_20395, partial [Mobilitalea sp.]
ITGILFAIILTMSACTSTNTNIIVSKNEEPSTVPTKAIEESNNTDENEFKIVSDNEKQSVIVVTLDDNGQKRITSIIVSNQESAIDISDVVGYYTDMSWHMNQVVAVINYCGRKWSNFLLIDVNQCKVLYQEPFTFAEVQEYFRSQVEKMDYEVNTNNIISLSLEKVINESQIIIGYQVYDMDDNKQSGMFTYDISNKTYSNLEQFEATRVG